MHSINNTVRFQINLSNQPRRLSKDVMDRNALWGRDLDSVCCDNYLQFATRKNETEGPSTDFWDFKENCIKHSQYF